MYNQIDMDNAAKYGNARILESGLVQNLKPNNVAMNEAIKRSHIIVLEWGAWQEPQILPSSKIINYLKTLSMSDQTSISCKQEPNSKVCNVDFFTGPVNIYSIIWSSDVINWAQQLQTDINDEPTNRSDHLLEMLNESHQVFTEISLELTADFVKLENIATVDGMVPQTFYENVANKNCERSSLCEKQECPPQQVSQNRDLKKVVPCNQSEYDQQTEVPDVNVKGNTPLIEHKEDVLCSLCSIS